MSAAIAALVFTCGFVLVCAIDYLTGQPMISINGVGIYIVGGLIGVYAVYQDIKSARGYWEDLE